MPTTTCNTCGGDYQWCWEEAFDKFGFNDGDGQCETERVADVLRDAGYKVDCETWGLHNTVIYSIKMSGKQQLPIDDEAVQIGYDDPREYLPPEIIALLDEKLGDNGKMEGR